MSASRQRALKLRENWRAAFTLIELLVVIAVIGILATLLLPSLARAKTRSQQVSCLSNLRQIGLGMNLYLSDNEERFPDRRELKDLLGYQPWTTWPPSDPRGGWVPHVLVNYLSHGKIWSCPAIESSRVRDLPQCTQNSKLGMADPSVSYWFWRFDRKENPIPLDNFWTKNLEQCLSDLRQANNPTVGMPHSGAEVELAVDPYFPGTISSVPEEIRGLAVHPRGRNRLFLDTHAAFSRDLRLK